MLLEQSFYSTTPESAADIPRFAAWLDAHHGPIRLLTAFVAAWATFLIVALPFGMGPLEDLELPGDSRIICLYRDEKLIFADSGLEMQKGDKIVILARLKDVDALRERWSKG